VQPNTQAHDKEYWITDLSSLADIIKGAKSSSPCTINIDMAGTTLGAPLPAPGLKLSAGITLRLSNGVLSLPPGCVLEVGPGAALELINMEISGQGSHEHGLVTVRGPGAVATLQQCRIRGQVIKDAQGSVKCDAVTVIAGARATLTDCSLTAAAGDGLSVRDAGSSASAADCVANGCGGNGYVVRLGGSLSAVLCTASMNKGAGFIALGNGSRLEAGPACKSSGEGARACQTACHCAPTALLSWQPVATCVQSS
jgi:hypothetical protein